MELEQLLRALEAMPTGDALYLDDVGWFQVHRYKAYEGRNPRTGEPVFVPAKTLVMFGADGNLLNTLDGRPREDLGDPTQPNGDFTIHRHDWAKPLAARVREDLCLRGTSDIAGFGTLRVEQRVVEYDDVDPPRRALENRVRWEMSEALRERFER